jgi:alpha,alpha-trehalose-phosphate synthase [UDP-forming]
MNARIHFSRGLRMGFLIAGIVGIATVVVAWFQWQAERRTDRDDLDRRARSLAYHFRDTVQEALSQPDPEAAKMLAGQVEGHSRLIGFAVFRADGRKVAAGKGITQYLDEIQPVVASALREKPEAIETIHSFDTVVHAFATRLTDEMGAPHGVLVVMHDIAHLEERGANRLIRFAFWIVIVTFMLIILVFGVTWSAYERPMNDLAEWMRRLRTDTAPESPPPNLPVALLATETKRLADSFRAARSSAAAESRSAIRDHKVWTRDRLRAQALDCLSGGQLVVVSNREPYMHQMKDGKPHLIVPAGGLVTALDPVLQACGGIWVAHGAGDADVETADASGRISVPPGNGCYTLRRVWLNRDEEQGYYYGLSNEGMWPLCHLAHERPMFRAVDWERYSEVNRRFADTILEEIGPSRATVLVQDYHLALVPQMLKEKRPDLHVGIFWHIPWPNPEAFRICPWRTEILKGMLGADLIGFHLQQYCNNFLDTVDRMVEARLDWDHFAAELGGHHSLVRPFPISVESWEERKVPMGDDLARQMAQLLERYKIHVGQILLGVDRIDYTKGLPERFRAFGRFLEKYPQHRGKIVFVQLGAPSRTHLRRYRDLIVELESLADEINWKYQSEDWKPIQFLVDHHDSSTVHAFMRLSSVCLVSSLHDGMNLVAKEYAAAKPDDDGVLILSEFAGAARELPDALIINPYNTEQFADAIRFAVEMDAEDRSARMQRMRRTIDEHNVYWWAASFLSELSGTRISDSRPDQLLTSSNKHKESAL